MPGLTVGAAVGYARSNLTMAGLRGTTDTYLGSLYASYTRGGFELDVQSALLGSEFQTSRTIALGTEQSTAASKSRATGALGDAEIGYRFRLGPADAFWIKPFAGVSVGNLSRNRFAETGAGALGLAFPSQQFSSAQSRLGAAFGTSIAAVDGVTYGAEIKAAWVRDLNDGTRWYRASLADQAMRSRLP